MNKIQLSNTKICLTLENVRHFKLVVDHEESKLESLCTLLETLTIKHRVIHVNSRQKIDCLVDMIQHKEFTVFCVHDQMVPKDRSIVLSEFCNGPSGVLVTSTRHVGGMDLQEVSSLVIK